jgi:glycosyltransferase involved in cell wall biosynthesis
MHSLNDLRISIITVVFNSEKTFAKTINSILNQSKPVYEYIIIDGNSTDTTLEIANSFIPLFKKKGIIYKIFSEQDHGIYDAMNKGILKVTGDWIGIINADDFYEIKTIALIQNFLKNETQTELIHGNINIIKNNSSSIHKPDIDLKILYNSMSIYHPSIFIKKTIYDTHGLYSLDYKLSSDWELVLRFYDKNVKFQYLNKTLANFTNGGIGSGFRFIHLTERIKIRHKYFNLTSLLYDLKDFIILIYFKFK